MDSKQINFSVETCFKKFEQSFNRTKYFSCIMDNLNTEMLPNKWDIKNKSGLNFSMPEPPDKQYLVEGCKHFMQRYLVRDCIESFALCLDELFFVFLLRGKKVLPKQTLNDALSDEEKIRLTNFQKAGIFGKIEKLENKFNLKLPKKYKQIITSLKDIRNCFAHNNGLVRADDGKKDGEQNRKFLWMTLSFFGVGVESGERHEIESNKPFKEEVNICMKVNEHFKSFKKGEDLSFSSMESYEIAWSLHLATNEFIKITGNILSADNVS